MFGLSVRKPAAIAPIATEEKSLSEIMAEGCGRLRVLPVHTPQGQRKAEAICGELKAFFQTHGITHQQVVAALVDAVGTDESVHEDWLKFFLNPKKTGFNIFPIEVQAAAPEPKALAGDGEENIYDLAKDIPKSLAKSHLSIFLLGQPGTGKTTLQRALAGLTVKHIPGAECMVVSLQADKWLGLQKSQDIASLPDINLSGDAFSPAYHRPNTVTYATPGVDEDMLLITEAVKHVWGIYQERVKRKQLAARGGGAPPDDHAFRLFFNEWNIFYGWAGEFKTAAKTKEFREMAWRKGIKDPLMPMEAILRVGYIFSSGRDINLSCCIAGQSILKDDTGFNSSMVSNINVAGVGRVSQEHGDGGYEGPMSLVSDQWRIKDNRVRAILREGLDGFIKRDEPVLISTQGHGAIGSLRDYSRLSNDNMLSLYRHEIY